MEIPNLPAMEESADYTETKQGITLQAEQIQKNDSGRPFLNESMRELKMFTGMKELRQSLI